MNSSGVLSVLRYDKAIFVVLTLVLLAAPVTADVYQWEWIDPLKPYDGRQVSANLCPDGAGITAGPGANLAGLDLQQAYFDVSLAGANLAGANLADAYVAQSLEAADLSGATIRGVDFAPTTDMSQEQLYSTASYQQGDLRGTSLALRTQGLYGPGWDLSNQDLTGSNLIGSWLVGASLRGANLTDADLLGVAVSGADFTDTEIGGARLMVGMGFGLAAEQLYSTASYQRRDLRNVRFSASSFAGFRMAGVDFTGSELPGVDITNADFRDATITSGQLRGSAAEGADMRGTTILPETAAFRNNRNIILGDGSILEWDIRDDEHLNIRNHINGIGVSGDLQMAPLGTVAIRLGDDLWASTIVCDLQAAATLDGTLDLALDGVDDPESMIGTEFDLFDWPAGGPAGQFAAIITPTGYQWDTSDLYAGGTVTLTAVPEPSCAALVLIGFIAAHRRRPLPARSRLRCAPPYAARQRNVKT